MKKMTALKNSNTMSNALELEDEDKNSYLSLDNISMWLFVIKKSTYYSNKCFEVR